ncbi:MAG: DNA oxidative demethylase AlkB [Proteobacteria bacterium]|nr:MAG: DNA oxidative demethylase AlkB [Pseudomonadota bacterium]
MLQFDEFFGENYKPEAIAEGAVILREFAIQDAPFLLKAVDEIVSQAPFRAMYTQGGLKMSVTSTGCGDMDWFDEYSQDSAQSRSPLPPMPPIFIDFAKRVAKESGYEGYVPDSCLINRYVPAAKLGLHQDRDEWDLRSPILSLSLGLPIVFLFGGLERSDKVRRIPLDHGDVVVWGGASRLFFHGVNPLKDGLHPLLGRQRINLTFRKHKT